MSAKKKVAPRLFKIIDQDGDTFGPYPTEEACREALVKSLQDSNAVEDWRFDMYKHLGAFSMSIVRENKVTVKKLS